MDERAGETPTDKALAMLAAFGSVGARLFNVTLTDINGENLPRLHYPAWLQPHSGTKRLPDIELEELCRRISRLLSDAERTRRNVIIRPRSSAALIQLDDLDSSQAEKLKPQAFIVLRTSPGLDGSGNFQAWVAVKDVPADQDQAKDFARRLRKGTGADRTATGATRIAGSLNFKPRYGPTYPRVEMVHANTGRMTTPAELEQAGFVAQEEPQQPPASVPLRKLSPQPASARKWPDYQQALRGAPMKSDGVGPDRSMADFMWSKWAVERGWSTEEVAEKLLEVSAKAQENARRGDKGYALLTARNAEKAVERERGPRQQLPPRPV